MKNIVALSGSLRKDSFNTKILNEIKTILGNKAEYEILDISDIPLFNEDVENKGVPKVVDNLLKKIDEADLVIIASPEYNYSISGVLKNALDWFSRGDIPALIDKKAAILSTSISRFGGVRAQEHLRDILFSMELDVLKRPELMISNAMDIFKDGVLTDETVKKQLNKFVTAILESID